MPRASDAAEEPTVDAAAPDRAAARHRLIALTLEDDRSRKNQDIRALERDIAHRLAKTPYVLLMSFPGINVVSAGDFAGEMGPIENYANPKAITGRAGIFPSRYQSDRVDRANGPLVRRANRALRAVIMGIADNLILCNVYFRNKAALWKSIPNFLRTRSNCRSFWWHNSSPSIITSPESGMINPMMCLSSTLFPPPLRPMMTTDSPVSTRKLTSSRMTFRPKLLVRWLTSIIQVQ